MCVCRHRAHPDVGSDRVSPCRSEKLCLQLCCHADETRVPQQDRPQVQKEDRGHGSVSTLSYLLEGLDWMLMTICELKSFYYNPHPVTPPPPHHPPPVVQIPQRWMRRTLRAPLVASSCPRMSCCVSPARTTCPTA